MSQLPQINCLRCLDCPDNYTCQSRFEDGCKGAKLIGPPRNSPYCWRVALTLLIVQEAVGGLPSLDHWRPNTLPRANLSFSEFEIWGLRIDPTGALELERPELSRIRQGSWAFVPHIDQSLAMGGPREGCILREQPVLLLPVVGA